MKDQPPQKNFDQARAEAELEKLNLEIKNLKYKNRWEGKITLFIPFISVLVAVFGFLFGIYQFQSQQKLQQDRTINEQQKDRESRKREQDIRLQNQIREDIDQLVQFTSNKGITISRSVFLLADLQRLLSYTTDEGESDIQAKVNSENQSKRRREITRSLIAMLINDCDLTDHRHADFAMTLASDWDDTLTYLLGEPDQNAVIVEKYLDAIARLQQKNPEVFKTLTYDEQKDEYFQEFSNMADFYHFSTLMAGLKSHLGLFEDDPEERSKYVRQFQGILCNPTFTQQSFGQAFSDVNCEE